MASKKYRKSPSPQNRQAQSHFQQAVHFHRQEQFDAALACYGKVIALKPDYVEAYAYRGALYVQSNQKERALADLNKAIALRPDYAEAYRNRGALYVQSNEKELAVADFSKVVELRPDHVDAYIYRGEVLISMKQYALALESLEKAVQLNPASSRAYNNIGIAFMDNGQLDIAMEYYEKALELKPDSVPAHGNYGLALSRMNRHHEAIEWYDRVIALNPDFSPACHNKFLSLMIMGHFAEAGPLYEHRFNISSLGLKKMDVPGKRWSGETSLEGKTLLLCHDEGYGDTIQFCRYAKLASRQGAKVILQVPGPLANLLENLEGVDELVPHHADLNLETLDQFPPFDLYCPLVGLPFAFRTELETIPGEAPYLFANPAKIAVWEKRLGEKTKPRVGLVWSGSAIHTNDHNRSVTLAQLLPYLPANCEYISLQKEVRDMDKIILAVMSEWKHYGEELEDFSDTAALCSLMDVVVSVDTSVAHLSGALGRPTWIMLPFYPDWRWLLDRTDSPWYPDVRLYRQSERGNWNNVFEAIREDLLHIRV